MRLGFVAAVSFILLLVSEAVHAQPKRINYNNQQLFLSGGNLAWMSWASDIGPGPVDYSAFADILLQIHNNGGNSVRWWLHTDGSNTPAFNDTGLVVGPGVNTIANVRRALNLAWERHVGVNLCLWSFGMLFVTNTQTVLDRNRKLLSDTAFIHAYVNNCLVPMVDSLKGHPAIIAWEVFNEPEGMSDSYYFTNPDVGHVPDAYIQRFVNVCAGAIHRADRNALVTNGAWSFRSLSSVVASVRLEKFKLEDPQVSSAQRQQMVRAYEQRYHVTTTADEIERYQERISAIQSYNWYSDHQLITQGGDSLGTLDFYEVHYYTWGQTSLSPFHNTAGYWGLSKPIVVAEFGITDVTTTYPSFSKQGLYDVLYQNNYAGAMAWSWTDVNLTTHADMLAACKYMWDNHTADIGIAGVVGDWPTVTITSPADNDIYPDSTHMTIRTTVVDTLVVDSVTFFVADTQRIGSVSVADSLVADTSYYTFMWTNIPAGQYAVKAVATNDSAHQGTSSLIHLTFGKPPMIRLEAESAMRTGPGMSVGSDASASRGAYVNLSTGSNDTSAKITWQFTNVSSAGTYQIAFGYKVPFGTKTQFINVNGTQVAALTFDGASTSIWYEKGLNVPLVAGPNTIQMQMSWGWMYVDYLAVPTDVLTSVEVSSQPPRSFALLQNYPNPFNPKTTIKYAIPSSQHVRLTLFDLLGREIARIVDQDQHAGFYSISFDAGKFSSGVYFYRMEAGTFSQTKRMLLLK